MRDAIGDSKIAGLLLMSTPVFGLVAAAAWLIGRLGSEGVPLLMLQPRWTVLWACVLAGATAFAVGSYLAIGVFDDGPRAAVFGHLAVMIVPLGLVSLGLATFTSRAIVRRDSTYAIATEDLSLVLNVLAAVTNAVVLTMAILVGVVLVGLAAAFESRPDWPDLLASIGQVLGALVVVVNLALLVVGETRLLFMFGIGTVLLAVGWLLPVGWLLVQFDPDGSRRL